jgi:hypothetical protein
MSANNVLLRAVHAAALRLRALVSTPKCCFRLTASVCSDSDTAARCSASLARCAAAALTAFSDLVKPVVV